MRSRIEVIINETDYPMDWTSCQPLYESWIIGRLLEAGIPVKGILIFNGVKKGSLSWSKSFDRPTEMLFIWRDDVHSSS